MQSVNIFKGSTTFFKFFLQWTHDSAVMNQLLIRDKYIYIYNFFLLSRCRFMASFVFWYWRKAPHWLLSYEDRPQFFPLALIKRINHRNDWGANVWIWMKAACVRFADSTHCILIFKHVCACILSAHLRFAYIYIFFFHSVLIVIQAEHLREDTTHCAEGRCLKLCSRTFSSTIQTFRNSAGSARNFQPRLFPLCCPHLWAKTCI